MTFQLERRHSLRGFLSPRPDSSRLFSFVKSGDYRQESYSQLNDKKFSKAEQEYLSTIFSNQKVSSLKSFLNNSNSDEIENRMKSELHRSIDLPKAKKNEIKEKLKDYIENFSSNNDMNLIKAHGKILGILN